MKVRLVTDEPDTVTLPATDEVGVVELPAADEVTKAPDKPPEVDKLPKVEDLLFEMESEPPLRAEECIDLTMVGELLTRSVLNTSSAVWRECYPCAFWMKDGERLAGPSSKSSCLGDIRPGLREKFVVMIPRFPIGVKPDLLRIAILEDKIGWHTVEDIGVR